MTDTAAPRTERVDFRATSDPDQELFGASIAETRAFAMQALDRRLRVIGLAAAA